LLWHHTSRKDEDEDNENDEKNMKRTKAHDAGIGDPGSVELSNEEVVALVEHLGFTMEQQENAISETGYISNPRSMLQNNYRPVFWIARRSTNAGDLIPSMMDSSM
jgi:hypothetical protein